MLRSRLATGLLLTFTGFAVACGDSKVEEEGDVNIDNLRSNPNGEVSTTDPSARLLAGYNAFLDRASSSPCIAAQTPEQPSVGDVASTFYLRHVKTRDELAKELDVEVGASLSAPAGSVDASGKLVKTFKQSATTVTFLVRALRSYSVANRSPLGLTPEAKGLLENNNTPEFLKKCGGSFIQSVRYEAQVLAIMQFEAKNEESARKIAASLGGSSSQVVPVGNARADIKMKAEQTAQSENASLSLSVVASGFLSRGRTAGDIVGNTFEKIDELRTEMATSFDADLAADRRDYFANRARNVRAASVGQNSYAQISDAPNADFTGMTQTLAKAEEFVRYLGPVQLRMETAYNDEVMRFLNDSQFQYRYNLLNAPKKRTAELVPIAQRWATTFGPDGTRNPGSLIDPLRQSIDRCKSAASNGNYLLCKADADIDGKKTAADRALADYARSGRIVQVSAWMPTNEMSPEDKGSPEATHVSYRNAEDLCTQGGMRLPKRNEMPYLAPAVTALATPSGEVWFAADGSCTKPVYRNNSGQGQYLCGDTWNEFLPWVDDRAVVCVSRAGVVPALPAP
jgi:hypothetical protein